jgi:hypothetical protein
MLRFDGSATNGRTTAAAQFGLADIDIRKQTSNNGSMIDRAMIGRSVRQT